jgi:hypothetical protein
MASPPLRYRLDYNNFLGIAKRFLQRARQLAGRRAAPNAARCREVMTPLHPNQARKLSMLASGH